MRSTSQETWRKILMHKKIYGEKNLQFEVPKKLLILVPSDFSKPWKAGSGNFFFEIYASAKDYFPNSRVELLFIEESSVDWISEVVQVVLKNPNISIVALIEKDPNTRDNQWNFDRLIIEMRPFWNGLLIGILFDSVWPIFLARANLLAKMDSGTLLVSIDRSIKSALPFQAFTCGPLLLPISSESVDYINKHLQGSVKKRDVSFVGKLYPSREYRVSSYQKAIPNLNYHSESNIERLDYIDYLRILKESQFTLNLARANAQSIFQLKCRILEASLVGSIIISDERKYISKYLRSSQYIYAPSGKGLKGKIRRFISDNPNIEELRYELMQNAIKIAPTNFWDEICEAIRKTRKP
jgi:hypothetical protein